MPKDNIKQIIDRVLWMPLPTLDRLSADLVKNRRNEQRYPVHTEARLLGANFGEERKVVVVNVSKSGVGIQSSMPLEVGSTAMLIAETTIVAGQVRWCRIKDDDTFESGILANRVGLLQ